MGIRPYIRNFVRRTLEVWPPPGVPGARLFRRRRQAAARASRRIARHVQFSFPKKRADRLRHAGHPADAPHRQTAAIHQLPVAADVMAGITNAGQLPERRAASRA